MHKLHSHCFKQTIISKNSHGYAPLYAPPPRRNLEETLNAFIEKQETINTQLAQSMTDFKDTLAKFTSALCFQERGKFHLNHSKIQRGNTMQMQVVPKANTWIKSNQSSLFAVVRLLKNSFLTCEKDDELIFEGKEEVESEHCKEKTDSPPTLPFPHAMTKERKVNHNSEIFETFKHVRINIPLLDAIKHVLSYAKFLKDLCTVKRKLNVKKKAFLAEQVSVILQNNNALKYKDPAIL